MQITEICLAFLYPWLSDYVCLQKEQVKRLHLLLTVKDSAANIPKNLEAQRRLQFFTNSLFMDMPAAKPVSEMIPFRYCKYVWTSFYFKNRNLLTPNYLVQQCVYPILQ